MNNTKECIENFKKLIFDINSIKPRCNAELSNYLGLRFDGMSRPDYITYSFIILDYDNYKSDNRSNILSIYNDNTIDSISSNTLKINFQNQLTNLVDIAKNIISQQKNKTIQQCKLRELLFTKELDPKDNLILNLVQLMENSNIVKIENNGKKMITLGDNLIYNHIVPNLDKKHASKYEAMVAVYLDQLKNITELKCQKTFNDCKDKKRLPFDFYFEIENQPIVIEYNGIQHYKPIDFFGGEEALILRQKHDKIKKEYCNDNNIKFIEISCEINNKKLIFDYLNNMLKEFNNL
jgi:hypothetical protein